MLVQGVHFRGALGRLFWHLPGRPRAVAPQSRPLAVPRSPTRGRPGSGSEHWRVRPASLCSALPGWGPGRLDVPEPRASAPFLGGADVNSFLPGGEKTAFSHLPLLGRPAAESVPGAAGRRPKAKPGVCARAARSARPSPRRSSPRSLLPAEGGVRSPDLIAGAEARRPLPRSPGDWEGRRRRGNRTGLAVGEWDRGPGDSHMGPRAGRQPVACGEPGPARSDSENTLFNYIVPRPPSAIGAF